MHRPLIYLLIALIAGIIVGCHFTVPYYLILAVITLILFFLVVTIRNHGCETTKQDLETDSAASCGIVQLTNSSAHRFRNWSFTNKWSTAGFFLIISFILVLGVFDIQKQQYFVEHEQHIGRYIDTGKLTIEGMVIESPLAYLDKNVLIVRCLRVIRDKSYIPVSGNIR